MKLNGKTIIDSCNFIDQSIAFLFSDGTACEISCREYYYGALLHFELIDKERFEYLKENQ